MEPESVDCVVSVSFSFAGVVVAMLDESVLVASPVVTGVEVAMLGIPEAVASVEVAMFSGDVVPLAAAVGTGCVSAWLG